MTYCEWGIFMSIRKLNSKHITASQRSYIGKAGELLIIPELQILVITDGVNTVEDLVSNGQILTTPDTLNAIAQDPTWASSRW